MQQASSHAGSLMAGYMTISINHVAVYEIGESVERREGVRPGRTPASYTKTELAVHAHGKLHGRLEVQACDMNTAPASPQPSQSASGRVLHFLSPSYKSARMTH
jgi:hypothetical protein